MMPFNIGLSSSSSFGANFGDNILQGGLGASQATSTGAASVPRWVWFAGAGIALAALYLLFRK